MKRASDSTCDAQSVCPACMKAFRDERSLNRHIAQCRDRAEQHRLVEERLKQQQAMDATSQAVDDSTCTNALCQSTCDDDHHEGLMRMFTRWRVRHFAGYQCAIDQR